MKMTRPRNWIKVLFPFGWGNVTKLALAYFFSTLYFYIPVGTLYLRGKDLTYLEINSLWGIIVFTMFLTEVPTGLLADRIGRRYAISLAFGFQLVGEVIYVFADSYPGFAAASIAGGVGFAFASGCVDALVYDALKARGREGEMSKAMGYIEASQRLANLLAFTAGGFFVSRLTQPRFVAAIAATACMVGIAFLISFSLQDRAGELPPERGPRPLALLGDGIALLRQNRAFRSLVVLSLATIPFQDYLGSLYQPHFVAAEVPPPWFGLARSIAAGLSILSARYAYWLEKRLGRTRALLFATALPGALYLVMAGTTDPFLAVVTFCALSGSMGFKGPIFAGQLNAHIESHNRATVLSIISMVSGAYVALMGLLIGRIADRATVTAALLTMGGIVLTGAIVFRVTGASE
jgi:MFS family permease